MAEMVQPDAVTPGSIPDAEILVIDDSAELCRFCEIHLGLQGWTVRSAADGSAALAGLYDGVTPSVVLLDQMLPERDGLTLLPELQAAAPEVPVIMLTGHASVPLVTEFMRRGGTDFLEKPIDPEVLVLKVERALREARLRDQRDRAAAFLGNLGHELRTPVTVVGRMLDLLVDRIAPGLDGEACTALDRLQANTEMLERLVVQMTDLHAMEGDDYPYHFETTPLGALLSGVAADHAGRARDDGGHDLVLAGSADTHILLRADTARLSIALASLLDNALRFADPDTAVELGATVDGGSVRITVTNEGPAIPVAEREAIFRPFVPASTDNGGGGGMGLARARRIVAAHGGTVTAASADGRTTFTVTLPATAAEPEGTC